MSDPVPIHIIAIGDGCVGKTSMLITYTQNKFPTDYVPTIFNDNFPTTVSIDTTLVDLGLW